MPAAELVIYSTIIAILWLGGLEIVAGNIMAGDLISFLTYVMQILMSLIMLAMVLLQLTRAKASAERVSDVLTTDVDITSPDNGLTSSLDGSISYEDVTFAYPGSENNSPMDINLDIKLAKLSVCWSHRFGQVNPLIADSAPLRCERRQSFSRRKRRARLRSDSLA